ncbi:uncharacterized protein LOC120256728 [Dioscorea cayenensis subsp. rotundata]|uniref:Uncharacterized protein LOC120256728 n=1 Tax=Dioscorea cayennensis subsp. rotundata TaxID=55577 RepID=A0AB40AZ97_DIOCR|nr:uncharacterized protein LOC120256728 [Dioscorea cayenensis subsp. rotundata]
MDGYANLSALKRQCSVKWAQGALLMWINDGDKNTNFFHALTRICAYANHISQVVDSNGNTCCEHEHIEQAFLHYYKNLWTTLNNTSVGILDALPTALPCLSATKSDMLCREVSRDEVYHTISALLAGKSPGPDGFNSKFFTKFWPIIGDQTDTMNTPRMLIKLDIEKAYDTIDWNAILAIISCMNFPDHWISWVSTCLQSCSFSLLINGSLSPWFSSSRGVRQGDPISSYLFILVSQTLTHMLNISFSINMIHGFNPNLSNNFNHLMYADDLILITQGSRKAARSVNLCLDLYSKLTSQCPNLSKSHIYFPSWYNKHVSNRICSILNLKAASIPFKYLGVLISPKRIASSAFMHIVDKISLTYKRCSNFHLSPTAKTVLIKSTILSIPTYTLSVYLIPDGILSVITKVVRKFFWSRDSNGKGIHNVSWNVINEGKTEEGIGIRNLALAKYSLMAKHVFKYLNNDDAIWVNILKLKYGDINFWKNSTLANCSWIFHSIFRTDDRIKPFCRINSVNVNCTSLN